jgi:hypothetical protein
MKTMVGWSLAVVALLGAIPFAATAQHPERVWRGDIRHFERHDSHQWRSGAWRHGSHAGRDGWWWVVGGLWYFYPQPVYPYPDPYRPPLVVVEPSQPPVVLQVAPAAQSAPQSPPAATQPAAQFWYYCEAERGYYPYVVSCPSGWKTVPATPPGGPQ